MAFYPSITPQYSSLSKSTPISQYARSTSKRRIRLFFGAVVLTCILSYAFISKTIVLTSYGSEAGYEDIYGLESNGNGNGIDDGSIIQSQLELEDIQKSAEDILDVESSGGGSSSIGSNGINGQGGYQKEPEYIPWDPKTLTPDDPTPEQLPLGTSLFPTIDVNEIEPPEELPFPSEMFEGLYPKPQREPTEEVPFKMTIPEGSHILTWKSPDWFKANTKGEGRKELPRVQYDFEDDPEGWGEESSERREIREERREAVKRGFVYAWSKYKKYAWGHDEVKPVTLQTSNPFQNWGASIIDSLETLLIMGLSSEYDQCRPHINQLDFKIINGHDWARGSRAFSEDGETTASSPLGRDRTVMMGTFEVGIRYLGGLIGGYDLSGDKLLLDRAAELGKLLGKGFETPSGLVMPRFDAGSLQEFLNIGRVSLAEVGSMTLELTRLSQLTGDKWYFNQAQRAIDYLQEKVIPHTTQSPLIPAMFHAQPSGNNEISGTYSFGGLADSYYEYLIKQHQLIGGATDQFRDMYAAAMDKAEEKLYAEAGVLKGKHTLTIGTRNGNSNMMNAVLEHLTCFAGGMLGLGARLLNRPKDLGYGKRVTQTCYWLGADTPSGLQPESVTFFSSEEPAAFSKIAYDGVDGSPSYIKEEITGSPSGTKGVNGKYLGRPETIESVFYMYRLTGDRKWQDKGWRMFVAWTKACVAPGGYSSVGDVRKINPTWTDNMESFVFAETFKYHYLLHSEPDLISLDDYVFTTEAHPLIANPSIKPGSQGWWKKPRNADANLGVRARGTDAQFWTRHAFLKQFAVNKFAPHQVRPPPVPVVNLQAPNPNKRPAVKPIINKNPEHTDDD